MFLGFVAVCLMDHARYSTDKGPTVATLRLESVPYLSLPLGGEVTEQLLVNREKLFLYLLIGRAGLLASHRCSIVASTDHWVKDSTDVNTSARVSHLS